MMSLTLADPMLRDASDADRYARREYGAPDAASLLFGVRSPSKPKPIGTTPTRDRLLGRITQTIASFLL